MHKCKTYRVSFSSDILIAAETPEEACEALVTSIFSDAPEAVEVTNDTEAEYEISMYWTGFVAGRISVVPEDEDIEEAEKALSPLEETV